MTLLRHALLGLLARQPLHGYDLKHGLEEVLGGYWDINFGQIYSTLSRLERDGLAEVVEGEHGGRGKKTYALTDEGRAELETWIDQPTEKTRFKDEFFIKLIVRHLTGYGDASGLIARQRRAYLQRLRDLTGLASQAEVDPFVALLIEGAILHLQADLKWLDVCDERIENLRRNE